MNLSNKILICEASISSFFKLIILSLIVFLDFYDDILAEKLRNQQEHQQFYCLAWIRILFGFTGDFLRDFPRDFTQIPPPVSRNQPTTTDGMTYIIIQFKQIVHQSI